MRSSRTYSFCLFRTWVSAIVVLGVVALCVPSANAVDEIWFSTSSTVPGSAGNITANYNSLGSQTLYVWITSNVGDEITPPDTGYIDVVINGVTNHVPDSAAGIAANYSVTAGSSISLTGAMGINPVLVGSNPASTRWDAASNFGPGNFNVTPTSITQVNAVTTGIRFNGDGSFASQPGIHLGLSSANVGTGGNPTDPDYVNGDWLLGTVTFDTITIGSSTLAIQQSTLGIFSGPETDLTNAYKYDSATVTVVPEPASVSLIAMGGLIVMMTQRKRLF